MIELYNEFASVIKTAKSNPDFLFLLVFLFILGRFAGKLTKRINSWKVLALFFVTLAVYDALRQIGPILVGIFLAGVLSNHVQTAMSILSWAGDLKEALFAHRYRSAYQDIRRREKELEERERKVREAERQQTYRSQDQGQRSQWQQEAGGFRQSQRDGKAGGSSQKQENGSYGAQGTNQRDSHLKALGLVPGKAYSPQDIKRAYRKAAMKTHPDAGGTQSEFIKVQEAYKWLMDNENC